jgi:hypothetical protein
MKIFFAILGILICLASVLGGIYVGLWVCFIGGIATLIDMYNGAIAFGGLDVSINVAKVFFATPAGVATAVFGCIFGGGMATAALN